MSKRLFYFTFFLSESWSGLDPELDQPRLDVALPAIVLELGGEAALSCAELLSLLTEEVASERVGIDLLCEEVAHRCMGELLSDICEQSTDVLQVPIHERDQPFSVLQAEIDAK